MYKKKILKTLSSLFAVSALVFTLGCGSDKAAEYKPMSQAKAVEATLKDLNPVVESSMPLKVVASTIGHNDDGYVVCCDSSFSDFYVVDKKNKRVGRVYARPGHEPFYMAYSHRFDRLPSAMVFYMVIYKADRNSPDAHLGYWHDDAHILPVYALLDFDRNSDKILLRNASSGLGEFPKHYQAPVSDPKNLDMIRLLFSESIELNVLMKEKNKYYAVP